MSDTQTSPTDPLRLSPQGFRRFCSFITSELGIKMSENKLPMLRSRLQRRLRVLNLATLNDYQDFLFSPEGEEERVHFINAVTTNKTDFFREPRHFEYLVREALPAVDPERGGGAGEPQPWPFRLWCAGCSSGEEPYTLSMVLAEYSGRRPGFDFSILATDISTRVLDHAAMGIYDFARIDPVPAELRKKFLLRSKDPARELVRIIPALRSRVTFRRLNFMDDDYGVRERFEVIFFRNVMIYFDKPTQEAVINKLCRNLVPGGFLFVGHSESLAGLDIPVVSVGASVYRKSP